MCFWDTKNLKCMKGYVIWKQFMLLSIGLYAVGLYRKPGLQAAVNNLKSVLTSTGELRTTAKMA